jgi:hypothetical protein
LVLPKIKGLDDYVPPEEFIDDSVNERIEKAGKDTPNKPNKAARNLPITTMAKPLKPKLKQVEKSKEKVKKKGQ